MVSEDVEMPTGAGPVGSVQMVTSASVTLLLSLYRSILEGEQAGPRW